MTLQAQIDALEKLATIDSDLEELHEQLSKEKETFQGKKTHLATLEATLGHSRQSIEEMDRVRGDLIQEVRQMSIQIERSREKFSRCRTEREANAAQRELEELRRLYRDRELEIEKLSGLSEQARTEMDTTQTKHTELASEVGESETAVASRLGDAEKKTATKEEERKALVALVKPALYRRYEMVRKRRGRALAFTVDGTCSECHMRLPPMAFQKLMQSEDFTQCPSCQRILYYRVTDLESEDGAAKAEAELGSAEQKAAEPTKSADGDSSESAAPDTQSSSPS